MFEQIQHKVPTLYVARVALLTPRNEVVFVRDMGKEDYLKLPGGKRDMLRTAKRTETFAEAIVREALEEVGLQIVPYGEVVQTECRTMQKRRDSNYSGFKVTHASMGHIVGGALAPQAGEVSEIVLVPQAELISMHHELTDDTRCALGLLGLCDSFEQSLTELQARQAAA